ncbi:MAG: hypothetical protein U1E14_02040 [Geminicoccaceae bacterium]
MALAVAGTVLAAMPAMADGGRGHRGGDGGGAFMLMETFDFDKDGRITQVEIDAVRDQRFASFDSNKDGRLSLDEYKLLWIDAMQRPMVRQFQAQDEDGDAVLTVEEFRDRYARMVARMDRNGDGVLTLQDRRRDRDGDDDN